VGLRKNQIGRLRIVPLDQPLKRFYAPLVFAQQPQPRLQRTSISRMATWLPSSSTIFTSRYSRWFASSGSSPYWP
jgi:hypothetical protein